MRRLIVFPDEMYKALQDHCATAGVSVGRFVKTATMDLLRRQGVRVEIEETGRKRAGRPVPGAPDEPKPWWQG